MFRVNSTRARIAVFAASAVVGIAGYSSGALTTWTNATGNRLWVDPANWSGGVPTAADVAVLRATGSITLPTDGSAVARELQPSFSVISPATFEFVGGRLNTTHVNNFSPNFNILLGDVGSPADALAMRNTVVNGTIGDGSAGGGSFDVIAITSHLRGGSTTQGEAAISFSTIEAAGSVASANNVIWAGDATLSISSGFTNVNRLPDTGRLRLHNANFHVISTANAPVSEAIGTVSLDAGRQVIWLTSPAGGAYDLTSTALARDPGAVLFLIRSDTSRLRFVNSPTGPNGALPTDRAVLGYGYAYVSDGTTQRPSFVTYDAGADPSTIEDDPGLRGLAWSEYATSIPAGGNVRLTGANSLTADAPVRSLNLVDGALSLSGSTLNVNSGVILQGTAAGSGIGGTGALQFPGEATFLSFGASKQIDVPVHANSLTKGGDGELVLTRDNQFSDGVYIAAGTLTTRATGALGTATLTIAGGGDLRVEQESLTINHLVLPTLVKQNSAGSFNLAGFESRLHTAAGLTTTIVGSSPAGQLTLEGGGIVHVPGGRTVVPTLLIESGELRVDGTLGDDPSRANAVVTGGVLSGHGTVVGAIFTSPTLGGVIAPGPGVGMLTSHDLVLGNSHTSVPLPVLRLDINGTDAAEHDRLRVTDDFVSLTRFEFDLTVGYAAQFGDAFTVIDLLAPGTMIFAPPSNLPEGATFNSGGYSFRITYIGGTGNDVVLTVVPEPAGIALAMLAGVGIMWRRRRPK